MSAPHGTPRFPSDPAGLPQPRAALSNEDAAALDRVLDGASDTDAAAASLRERLAADPGLRAEAELQARINASLRRMYVPPASPANTAQPPAIAGSLGLEQPSSRTARTPWYRRLAIAAVLVAGGFGAWSAYQAAVQQGWIGRRPEIALMSLAQSYRRTQDLGFTPYWLCKDNEEFERSFVSRFGYPLRMNMEDPESRMLGILYTRTISTHTSAVLANVGENKDQVMVFIDLKSKDEGQPALADPALHQYRREVGPYVLYEITPLNEPKVLDLFYQPAR